MKKCKIFLILLLIPLLSSKCKKERDDCHKKITIQNNSGDTVIYSMKSRSTMDITQCFFSKNAVLSSKDSYDEHLRMCWEDELKERDFEFYILDPKNSNTGVYYDCDSIEQRNTILRHYIFTQNDLDNLKANNFTITYP
jgi:hypothetical protein